MKIVGYCVKGNKQYVAFRKNKDEFLHITDGFHDKKVTSEEEKSFTWVEANDIDITRILSRIRGTRPWHPLLGELKGED